MESKQIVMPKPCFQPGDLVEYSPENFPDSIFNYRLIGTGYVESVEYDEPSGYYIYKVEMFDVIKQQKKNLVEIIVGEQTAHYYQEIAERILKKIG
jgi:hypothetical protein